MPKWNIAGTLVHATVYKFVLLHSNCSIIASHKQAQMDRNDAGSQATAAQ